MRIHRPISLPQACLGGRRRPTRPESPPEVPLYRRSVARCLGAQAAAEPMLRRAHVARRAERWAAGSIAFASRVLVPRALKRWQGGACEGLGAGGERARVRHMPHREALVQLQSHPDAALEDARPHAEA